MVSRFVLFSILLLLLVFLVLSVGECRILLSALFPSVLQPAPWPPSDGTSTNGKSARGSTRKSARAQPLAAELPQNGTDNSVHIDFK